MELTVVVMAYDEIGSLASTVKEILGEAETIGCSYEVLIIDDGSTDGTGELADHLAKEFSAVRVIHHPSNLGLGGVYRTGFYSSLGARVTFLPADGQVPADTIVKMFALSNSHDMVLGHVPNRTCSYQARLLSWAERVLYRILFGKIPRFQGVLMFHRSLLKPMKLGSKGKGWGVLWEFILRATRAGCTYTNLATEVRARTSGTTKVQRAGVIYSNLRQVFALFRILRSPEKAESD
jgi:glycosyltransferase involved in cell wall biosynthesis